MRRSGDIFIVSAPSGCGKTTLVDRFLKTFKGVKRSVSATTRSPRPGEAHKKDYFFVSEKCFKKMAEKGEFLEWAQNFGYYYGTPKKALFEAVKKGSDAILTIDVKGAMQVRKKVPQAVLIFVMPPNARELSRRLKARATDDTKDVMNRLALAKREISQAKKYDYIIVNDDIFKAVERLKAIVSAKRCGVAGTKEMWR